MSLRTRRVGSAGDFQALASVWAELAARSGQSSPFLSHDWFACCWSALPPHRQPEVLLVEEAGSAVALLPLMGWQERAHGVPIRHLGFLESPDTPWTDMLVADGAGAAIEAVLGHLAARADWDVMRLPKLPAASPTLKALEAALPGRFPWRRAGVVPSPYLALEGTWESFWAAKSQRFKKTCRNIQNRLQRAGVLTVEEHQSVDPESSLFHAMTELTGRSWKADRGVAIATMPRMREFFADLTRRATARGWLSLWLLRIDGQPIAMEYQLRDGGRVNALRADYDAAHRDLSPGSALNLAIVRALFNRGSIHEYDMGPGLNEYKLRWASGSHETVDLRIYRPGLYPRALHAMEAVVLPAVRAVRERFR
jgi:CelD/BcsL family acetyltransferase involved in cellulose biosynthesis